MSEPVFTIEKRRFATVRRTAAYRAIVGAWDRPVLLACSGGIDSLALAAVATVARDAGRVAPFFVVQVDHQVRSGSEQEGRFVAAVAAAFACPFVPLRLAPDAARGGRGVEDGLRKARYASFAKLARRLGVNAVVTAHTRDDQIETVLLKLLSGAAPLAASGMPRERTVETGDGPLDVLRPLLSVARAQLVEVIEILELAHIEDPSNADVAFRRNRLRQRVIPELMALDPGFGSGLMRSVRLAARDALYADAVARRAFEECVCVADGQIRIPRTWLANQDLAIATRIVRYAVAEMISGDSREFTLERTEAIVQAAAGRTGARIELPYGIVAVVGRDHIELKWT